MMVDITPPQDREGFDQCSGIQQARMLDEFEAFLTRLINDAHERKQQILESIADTPEGKEGDGEFYVMVKYRSGTTMSPDAKLLEQNFPDRYQRWRQYEFNKFSPKLTKVALEALWQTEGTTREEKKQSKQRNMEEMARCMKEHPVKPQYSLASVAAREEWRKAHAEEVEG